MAKPLIYCDGELVTYLPGHPLMNQVELIGYHILLHYIPGRYAFDLCGRLMRAWFEPLPAGDLDREAIVKLGHWLSGEGLCHPATDVEDDGRWTKVHGHVRMDGLVSIYYDQYCTNGAPWRLNLGRQHFPGTSPDCIESYREAMVLSLGNDECALIYRGMRRIFEGRAAE